MFKNSRKARILLCFYTHSGDGVGINSAHQGHTAALPTVNPAVISVHLRGICNIIIIIIITVIISGHYSQSTLRVTSWVTGHRPTPLSALQA